LQKRDIPEIVLTGVNVGDYGKGEFGNKRHENTFMELVEALDQRVDVDRMRISSIEPNLLRNEIIEFTHRSKKFVPHFHIPLQSGSDTLLKLMKRRYMSGLYRQRVETIKAANPDTCIGVDVIVGFPGETEELFLETYNFLNELDISYLHVFTYSERANTLAAGMEGVVPIPSEKDATKCCEFSARRRKELFTKASWVNDARFYLKGKTEKGICTGIQTITLEYEHFGTLN
jgi:threonylcarbamoyladenosine tRNA methylthiotransferase MtaB